MVSIVVVSHSAWLADALVALAAQLGGQRCRLATAAGIDDPQAPFGTDAMKVTAAIKEVFEPDGVLVMMDAGSAILSAETALRLLPAEFAGKVVLCAGPLVEGTLAATVAASAGLPLERVQAEADGALIAKRTQLEKPVTQPTATFDTPSPSAYASGEHDFGQLQWTVRNRHGLHVRPAALLASVLAPFRAELVLEKNGQQADPHSINQICALEISFGDRIRLSACGPDANQAINAFWQLASADFGEREPVR